MFSGLTNQMSSWMGKKQEGGDEGGKPAEEGVPQEPEAGAEEAIKETTSPTKASRLDMLGSIGGLGGSVKSQVSSWLPSIPGLKKGEASETPADEASAEPAPEKPASPPAEEKDDDDASSATGGADSDAQNLSEGEETEDKDAAGIGAVSNKALAGAKSFGSFLYSAVNKAGKTVTEAGAKIKKTVEENSLLGEFNREQEAFLKEKQSKSGGAAVPPWVGRPNEESLKEECLSLSTDRRNFVRAPPAGVDFQFDLETQSPIAMATLAEDPNLEKMRFELVPKVISEENFWRNYFYRVSLICQANEVSSMAQEGGGSLDRNSSVEAEPTARTSDKERDVNACNLDGSPQHEFVSDTFAVSTEDIEEVKEGLKKLGIGTGTEEEWEKELEAELQDFEMVTSDTDKNLDNQIESELADLK